jgi:hypothetical protein
MLLLGRPLTPRSHYTQHHEAEYHHTGRGGIKLTANIGGGGIQSLWNQRLHQRQEEVEEPALLHPGQPYEEEWHDAYFDMLISYEYSGSYIIFSFNVERVRDEQRFNFTNASLLCSKM